jgi:hypothetical protein
MAAVKNLAIQELPRKFCRSGLIILQRMTLLFGKDIISLL